MCYKFFYVFVYVTTFLLIWRKEKWTPLTMWHIILSWGSTQPFYDLLHLVLTLLFYNGESLLYTPSIIMVPLKNLYQVTLYYWFLIPQFPIIVNNWSQFLGMAQLQYPKPSPYIEDEQSLLLPQVESDKFCVVRSWEVVTVLIGLPIKEFNMAQLSAQHLFFFLFLLVWYSCRVPISSW